MSSFEQKFSIGTSDGKHQIFWNISELVKDLKDAKIPIRLRKVLDLSKQNNFSGDSIYAIKQISKYHVS